MMQQLPLHKMPKKATLINFNIKISYLILFAWFVAKMSTAFSLLMSIKARQVVVWSANSAPFTFIIPSF